MGGEANFADCPLQCRRSSSGRFKSAPDRAHV